MLTILFLRTSMLRCSLGHQSHFKMCLIVFPKSVLAKEYKKQIILEYLWVFAFLGCSTVQTLRAWTPELNCLGPNI